MNEITFNDLIGKTILIGFTYYAHDNVPIEQKQFWGTVVESSPNVIRVQQRNGEIISLPPDLRSTEPAPPGKYRLRSTGEIIHDPDYLTAWNINSPPGGQKNDPSSTARTYPLQLSTPDGRKVLPVAHRVAREDDTVVHVTLEVEIDGRMLQFESGDTEGALCQLARALPEGHEILSCLSCRHGNFCPTGDSDNEIFCVSDFEPKRKSDLYFVTEDPGERDMRRRTLFHVCSKHAPHSPDYFTYSDYSLDPDRRRTEEKP